MRAFNSPRQSATSCQKILANLLAEGHTSTHNNDGKKNGYSNKKCRRHLVSEMLFIATFEHLNSNDTENLRVIKPATLIFEQHCSKDFNSLPLMAYGH